VLERAGESGGGGDGGAGIVACAGTRLLDGDTHVAAFGPFAVRVAGQGQGWGTVLLRWTEEHCRTVLGATAVEIEVVNYRTDLFPWYSKRGYEETGEVKRMDLEANGCVTQRSALTRPRCRYVMMRKAL